MLVTNPAPNVQKLVFDEYESEIGSPVTLIVESKWIIDFDRECELDRLLKRLEEDDE